MHEEEISLKKFISPFTTTKAVVWIIVIGIIVYFTMLFNGFVWDDLVFILNNPEIEKVSVLTAFGKNFFNNSGYYRPIPELYFSLLYTLFHQQAFFYHATQLLLHITCTVMLMFFLKKFFTKQIAFFLSLLFLIHPINVESVSYIAASQSELVFLFGMTAFLLVFYGKQTIKTYLFVTISLLCSFFVKETGVIFLLSLLFYVFLFQREMVKHYLIVGGITIGIYILVRFGLAQVFLGKMGFAPISQLSLPERLLTSPLVFFYYLKTVFLPLTLAIDQQWVVRTMTVSSFYLPLFADLCVIVGVVWLGVFYVREKMQKIYLFFILFFLASFGLIIQIFPLDMTVADRWFYVPFIGFLGILGVLVSMVKSIVWRNNLYVSLGIIILLLSLRTVVRNSDWYSLLTLYSHDTVIEKTFDNQNNYAIVLLQNGDTKKALSYFLRANESYPTEFSLRNTGMTYLVMHDTKHALMYLEKAMKAKSYVLPPHKHQTATYDAFIRYYLITKEYVKADLMATKGVHDYPDAYTLWYFKAITSSMRGNKRDALEASQQAYSLYSSPETKQLYDALKNNQPLPIQITN